MDVRETLAAHARHFYQRGWMVGTAGNLSARDPQGGFWITRSGTHKGELTRRDFVRVDLDGTVLDTSDEAHRPSAETTIHQAVYAAFPEVGACYHVHTVEANLVSRLTEADRIELPQLEMIKGLGIWNEVDHVWLDLFANHRVVPHIAHDLSARYADHAPMVPGMLIRDHGVTAWGADTERALHHVELFEYIFRYVVQARLALP